MVVMPKAPPSTTIPHPESIMLYLHSFMFSEKVMVFRKKGSTIKVVAQPLL
jgi:hypothetical protein